MTPPSSVDGALERPSMGNRCPSCDALIKLEAAWCGLCLSATGVSRPGDTTVGGPHPGGVPHDLRTLLAVPDELTTSWRSELMEQLRTRHLGFGAIVLLTALLSAGLVTRGIRPSGDAPPLTRTGVTSGGPLDGVSTSEPPP